MCAPMSKNAALVLVDHRLGLMTGVPDYSAGELKHDVVARARAAKVLNLPVVVIRTGRDSMWGADLSRTGGGDGRVSAGLAE